VAPINRYIHRSIVATDARQRQAFVLFFCFLPRHLFTKRRFRSLRNKASCTYFVCAGRQLANEYRSIHTASWRLLCLCFHHTFHMHVPWRNSKRVLVPTCLLALTPSVFSKLLTFIVVVASRLIIIRISSFSNTYRVLAS